MFNHARKAQGQAMRRRETREHVALYITAYNAFRAGEKVTTLRFNPREPMPRFDRTK
jgi:hypothetical protein